jgi:hypothetical protein
MLELLLMHVAMFLTLGQPWLASIQRSQRGRPETTMRGLLLPRAAPLLLPHARWWEALAATAPLLLLRAKRWEALAAATVLLQLSCARRWEALAAIAPFLLPHARRRPHPMTPLWRCGRCHLLLRHVWRRLHPTTPPRPTRATTMNALTSKR